MTMGTQEHPVEESDPLHIEIPFRPVTTATSSIREADDNDKEAESVFEMTLNRFVVQTEENRWHCRAPGCAKLFKGYLYWRKHLTLRHAELLETLIKEGGGDQDTKTVSSEERKNITIARPIDGRIEENGDELGRSLDIEAASDDDTSSCGSWQAVSRPGDRVEVIEEYIKSPQRPDLDFEEMEKFYKAAHDGDMDTLKPLIERGADVNGETLNGCTALVLAIMESQLEAVEYLLQSGADVNVRVHDLPPLSHAACQTKSALELCQLLVKYGANLNTISSLDSKNPLHWAATEGMVDVVEYLLAQGMAVDKPCIRGCTSLILAAEIGHTRVAEILLDHGAELNTRCENGGTPLIWSSRHNRVETVKFWLDRGVDINGTDSRGSTALRIASRFGHLDVVKILLERGADVSIISKIHSDSSALMAAVCGDHLDIAKILIKHGAALDFMNHEGWTALDFALDGKMNMVQAILEAMGDASSSKNSVSLQFAMARSHRSMKSLISVVSLMYTHFNPHTDAAEDYDWLEWVLNEGGEFVRPKTMRKLMLAACEGKNIKLLKALVRQKCDVNVRLDRGHNPLSYSVYHRNVDMVKVLLDAGADPSQATDLQPCYTPLDAAINQMKDGHDTEIVHLLLDSGRCRINKGVGPAATAFSHVLDKSKKWEFGLAEVLGIRMLDSIKDVNEDRCDQGGTLLHVATWRESEDFISLLLDRGADIEAKDDFGATAFLFACETRPSMVQVLAAKGADVRAQCKPNTCACSSAAAHGDVEVLNFLINKGLDIDSTNDKGITPLGHALFMRKEDAALFLLENGADVSWKFKDGTTVLHSAIRHKLSRVVRRLLEKDLDVHAKTDDGWTCLHEACATGTPWIVRDLLDKGADIEAPLPNGDRPLHVALINEHALIASLLIDKGANITARASQNQTPLHLATAYDAPSIARVLLEQKGVSTEDIDESTWTPLCCTTSMENMEILLEHNANVNYADCDGWTPIHQAVARGSVDCAFTLLQAGAKLLCRTTDDGLNVMERAEMLVNERKRRQMCFMLRCAMRQQLREERENKFSVMKGKRIEELGDE